MHCEGFAQGEWPATPASLHMWVACVAIAVAALFLLVQDGGGAMTTSSLSNVVAITSPDMFTSLMQQDLNRVTLLNFWAPWAQPCEPMMAAVRDLAVKYPHVLFMNIEAEEQPDVSESFDVEAVPTVVLLRGHTLLSKLTGGQPQAVEQVLAAHAKVPSASALGGGEQAQGADADVGKPHALPAHIDVSQESAEETERRCRELMSRSRVMLFMKGQPDMPRCGFSQKTITLLRDQNVEFDYYDILSDEPVRQTLKVLNDWPTFPQIMVQGELIGGLDILTEMVASGEFQHMISA